MTINVVTNINPHIAWDSPFLKGDGAMTIKEAIETTDTLKPNAFQAKEKIKWLSELDSRIKKKHRFQSA